MILLAPKLALFSFLALVRFHSIHISYAKGEVSDSTVHVRVSYYKDDFMTALSDWYAHASTSFEGDRLQNVQVMYFKNFFRIWGGAHFTHQLELSRYSLNDDGTSLIFDVTFTSDSLITMLTIDHRAICEEYSDQMNILTIHVFGQDKNVIANASKPTFTFTKP